MAQSNSYPRDIALKDKDMFSGTQVSALRTVNFTAQAVADYLNINGKISIGGQMAFKFVTVNPGRGTISLPGGGGNNANFSTITNLIVSTLDMSGQDVVNFIDYIVGSEILLTEQSHISTFGNYRITGYTVMVDPNFYDLEVEYIGGFGNITQDLYYDITFFKSGGDVPTRTSELINDGEDGVNPFISALALSPYLLSTTAASTYFPIPTGDTSQYIRGDGSLATFPTIDIPTLQSVVDTGNTVNNNNILFTNDSTDSTAYLDNFNLYLEDAVAGNYLKITKDKIARGKLGFTTDILFNDPSQANIIQVPDNSGTIALTSDIPSVTGFVPYTGATSDTDLGLFDITAAHLIKDGGVSSQFLKADGSVDNNIYLTSADLPSTLDLFATTTPDTLIPGYVVLVRNILDSRYNTTAVDVSTGAITATNQLLSSLITDTNVISGNPGVFNFTTIGNIRRVSGSGEATFYFIIYKRDSLGVETFIAQSDNTIPVIDGGTYVEFSAVALWNDGTFLSTDRIVLKFYANRLAGGSNPTYQFQFGGLTPVRSTAAVPVAVLPNIYLSNLVDVEDVAPLPNEVLYWNETANLWEHSSVINLLSPASSTVNGYLSSTDWNTFNGKQNTLTNPVTGAGTINYLPKFTGASALGNSIVYDTGSRIGIGGTGINIRFEVFSSQNYAGPTLGSKLVGTSSILSSNGLYGLYTGISDTGSTWIQSQRNDTATAYNINLQPSGGNVLINTIVNNGGKLQIKAGGALSTDIALRVRNSADTADLFAVNGDGGVIIGGVAKMSCSATVLTVTRPDNVGAGFQFSNGLNTAYGEFRWKDGSGADLARVSGTGSFIIGGTTPNASSLLDITSTTKGVLFPRMTTTQKNAIASPASGLVVYDTTLGKLCVRGAAAWETITSI